MSTIENEPTSKLLTDVEISVPEAVVEVLIEAGIDTVFGMPGGLMMHLYDALHDHPDEIRPVLVRQESIGTIMADVYGRLTGRPGWRPARGRGCSDPRAPARSRVSSRVHRCCC